MANLFAAKAMMKEPVVGDKPKPSIFKKKAVKKPEVKAPNGLLARLTGK